MRRQIPATIDCWFVKLSWLLRGRREEPSQQIRPAGCCHRSARRMSNPLDVHPITFLGDGREIVPPAKDYRFAAVAVHCQV
jgi:hypothetical protein